MNIAENLQAITNNVPLVYQTGCEESVDAFINKLQQIAPNAVMLDLNNLIISEYTSSVNLMRTYGASNNIRIAAPPDILHVSNYNNPDGAGTTEATLWGWCANSNFDCLWTIEDGCLFTTNYKVLNTDGTVRRGVSGKINIGFEEKFFQDNHAKLLISFKYKGSLSVARFILYDEVTNTAKVYSIKNGTEHSNWSETKLKDDWKHVFLTGDFSNYLAAGVTDKTITDTTLRFECYNDLYIKDFCVISLKN